MLITIKKFVTIYILNYFQNLLYQIMTSKVNYAKSDIYLKNINEHIINGMLLKRTNVPITVLAPIK